MLSRRVSWLLIVGLTVSMLCRACLAQVSPEAQAEFRASLLGKSLVLKSFGGDAELRYALVNRVLQVSRPTFRIFALFVPDEVTFSPEGILIAGQRTAAVFYSTDQQLHPGKDTKRVNLRIALSQPVSVMDVEGLEGLIFFSTAEQAITQIPERLGKQVPPMFDPARGRFVKQDRIWSTAPKDTSILDVLSNDRTIIRFNPGAHFPDHSKVNHATVMVSYVLEQDGSVSDVWVTEPFTSDFDDEAALAARQMRFAPPLHNGAPARFRLNQSLTWDR